MEAFEYASPKSLKEAMSLLGSTWSDAAVLAGGTDLIGLMKDYVVSPKRVVNIKGIKELGGISSRPGGVRIGSAVTLDEIATSPALKQFPSLQYAAAEAGSPQLRHMGTLGGNLCQRPRCWYYRAGFGLFATKDGKSLVENGDNRYHAIFGKGPARFVSASSIAPTLIALNAKIHVVGAKGKRDIDAAKFFVEPQSESDREIDLAPNEIVAEITIPAGVQQKNAAYQVKQRDSHDWAYVICAVAVGSNWANVVLNHVAPTPYVATEAGKALVGQTVTPQLAAKVADLAVAEAKPMSQNAYKIQLTKVAVKRAVLASAGIQA